MSKEIHSDRKVPTSCLETDSDAIAPPDKGLLAPPRIKPPSTLAALHRLRAEGRGLYTSEGDNFNNAIFGRDSLISARILISRFPSIAYETILSLTKLQGTREKLLSEEEPGRIHHEFRILNEFHTSQLNKVIMRLISRMWGGDSQEMLTYFSIDATPLYILLVSDYAKKFPNILQEKVVNKDRQEVAIGQSVASAADWIIKHKTPSGLIEVDRHNPTGLIHQTWKDSLTGYMLDNCKLTNVTTPMAYLLIQSLAKESLNKAAVQLADSTSKATIWKTEADALSKKTIEKFWMEDSQYFAASLSKDLNGREHQNKMLQSDAGWILNTDFFDDLPEKEKQKFISGIIRTLFSPDFLSDVGIRCRGLRYAEKLEFADYNGALVSWPIDTFMIAQGLRRQGLPRLADQLEVRILNAVNMAGDHYELFYVLPDGKVLLDVNAAKQKKPNAQILPIQNYPESGIAWTVAAVLAIKLRRGQNNTKIENPSKGSWQTNLEEEILAGIKNMTVCKTIDELRQKYPDQPHLYLDINKGTKRTVAMLMSQLPGQYVKYFFNRLKERVKD